MLPQLAPLFRPRHEIPGPLPNKPLSYAQTSANSCKIAVWNVRSLPTAAVSRRRNCITAKDPDIVIICESGWENAENADELYYLRPRYPHRYWKTGVAVLSKVEPISEPQYGFDGAFDYIQKDAERRCITLKFKDIVVIVSYFPNSGKEGQLKGRRQDFNSMFKSHISYIQKSSIWGADLNVVSREEDIEIFNDCWKRVPGCMDWERIEHGLLLEEMGFVGAWKVRHPKAREYTVRYGRWRLDSFLVSPQLQDKIYSCDIRHDLHDHFPNASDHWPCALVMEGHL